VLNFWLANKGVGINIGDVTASRNVMKAPSGGLVFVFGPKRGKRGPFAFHDNEFQLTGTVTDEGATGAFVFVNAQDVQISGNRVRVPAAHGISGVELRASNDVDLSGNQFTGTVQLVKADSTSSNVRTQP
jgi:hypothetical protein